MLEKNKVLTPADRLSELLCAVLMALCIIAAARIGTWRDGEIFSSRAIIFSAVGCNLAWGFIDGLLYIFSGILERGKQAKLVTSFKNGIEESAAKSAIEAELDGTIVDGLDAETRSQLTNMILSGLVNASPPSTRMTKDDFRGAIGIFALEFITAFMLVLPFFIFPAFAKFPYFLSNCIGLGMLFGIGCAWGKHTGRKIFISGLTMVLIGLVIFVLTMILGG
jgi:hypothetical protein